MGYVGVGSGYVGVGGCVWVYVLVWMALYAHTAPLFGSSMTYFGLDTSLIVVLLALVATLVLFVCLDRARLPLEPCLGLSSPLRWSR